MKRGNYEGGPAGPGAAPAASKRHRSDKFEVRLLVPSKCAGSIIGKGGQNIQKLRTEFNANIRVPDCPGPERVMTIHADTPDVVANVLEQTIPVLTEEVVRSGNNAPAKPGTEGEGNMLETRLLIHQSIVGGIIGRAGFKIKEIRDASGANIKVYQTCAPQSTDRCVAVQGTLQKIILALKEVFDVINNTEIKGVDQPYDPINFDGYYACEYGGFGTEMDVYGGPARGLGSMRGSVGGGMRGGGRGGSGGGFGGRGGGRGGSSSGEPMRNQPAFGGRSGYDDSGYSSGGGRGGGFAGGQRNNPRGGGYEVGYNNVDVANYGKNSNAGNNSFGGAPVEPSSAPFSGGGGGGGNGGQGEDSGEQETTQVTIPKDMAGAIIGPGGSRIRKIRSDSKASITIDEPVQGSNERIITISGSQRQIQTAQFLLQQSVREHAGPPPMAFGGPGRY